MGVTYDTYLYGRNGSALAYNGFLLGSDWWPNIQLPPFTMRVLFTDGFTPSARKGTWTQVSSSPNIWDVHHPDPNWSGLMSYDDDHPGIGYAHPTAYNALAVLGANTTGVTNMLNMLGSCSNMVRICPFDTSSVTNMYSMFHTCQALKKIPPMDTSHVTTMDYMFDTCTSITSIPPMDTSNVTSMYGMFSWCTKLKNIPLLDTSNVTTMDWMFDNCPKLKTIPLLDTSKVTSMLKMFYTCDSLETIPLLDTHNVRNMDSMFFRCSSLNVLPNLDTSNVAYFSNFCKECTSLQYIPDFSIASLSGQNFTDMFRETRNVAYGSYNMYVKLNNHMGDKLVPSSINKVFYNCGIDSPTGLVELNKIPVTYGGLKPIV